LIDAQRARALVVRKLHDEARPRFHRRAYFERCADRIRNMQRSPMVRDLDPLRRQFRAFEICHGFFKIFFRVNPQADALAD
jgi:hypothetical protein